ncbi:uncharacterized protein LOC117116794 [Anneissia japonica]|uniref:uncharacterized protein LOC117116794 n=1 Tax=Anneissia japonica TaxID=1529436 RepID=UPI0014258AAB|nr:uncharacterized protein LOC117116794 [Anneissia japonica]
MSSTTSSCNCTETTFECENGRCIPKDLRCNNYDNCGDASDEIDCNCEIYDRSCNPSGIGLCVPERWVCDGFQACDNENDELFCYCGERNFLCSNGKCIDALQVCDLINDCGTNEDEDGCIICPDGLNVPAFRVCDGRYDCADRSDETQCESCPEGWELWQHSCYYILGDLERTFSEGEQLCNDLGGFIVIIESEEENNFIFKILQDFDLDSTWIGITDRDEEGVWKPVAPTFSSYKNWDRDEPSNNADEHCGIMNIQLNGLWKDMVCFWVRYTVCEFRPIRLVTGKNPTDGIVELFYNNAWGSICSDNFGKNEADVVCRQLGLAYSEPLMCCSAIQYSHMYSNKVYSSITCTGDEDSLGECNKMTGNENCDSNAEAYIKCSKEGIRLSSGEAIHSGFVEVFKNDAWGTYCDIHADEFAANLTCQSLGYDHVTNFTNQATISIWSGTPINLGDIECSGDESSIFECTEPNTVLCHHDHDVHVQCSTECKQESLIAVSQVLLGIPVHEDIILEPCTVMSWTAHTSEGSFIELNITGISMLGIDSAQTCVGYFNISEPDGKSSIGPICGDVGLIPFVRSTTSQLSLLLGAGYRRQHIVFKAVFNNVEKPGCAFHGLGFSVLCEHPSAMLATFNYPYQYIGGSRYTWDITAPSTSHYILLSFNDFDIPGSRTCENDYITVNTDLKTDSELKLDLFCNANLPPLYFKSNRHKMVITFNSDYNDNGRGFLAEYDSYSFSNPYNSSTSLSTGKCPVGWIRYALSCYVFKKEAEYVTWTGAEHICQSEGAHLVSIRDSTEMLFIHFMLTNDWITDNDVTYIGLSQQRNTFSVYTWSDGSPLSYTAWHLTTTEEKLQDRQPLGGSLAECTVIEIVTLHSVDQWFGVACEYPSTNQFICKKRESEYHRNTILYPTADSTTSDACSDSEFECKNLECIQEIYKCDGQYKTQDIQYFYDYSFRLWQCR